MLQAVALLSGNINIITALPEAVSAWQETP
jgi:hypothetical protein